MLEKSHSVATLDDGDGARTEDVFRRATFAWALAAKKMVEAAASLSQTTRVSAAALADIIYVKDMVETMKMPAAKKTSTEEDPPLVTTEELTSSISGLITRIEDKSELGSASVFQAHVDDICGSPPILRGPVSKPAKDIDFTTPGEPQNHRGTNLSAPIHPRNGKMLWAGVDCPSCPSKATQRCQRDDGVFMEKPHASRKKVAGEDSPRSIE